MPDHEIRHPDEKCWVNPLNKAAFRKNNFFMRFNDCLRKRIKIPPEMLAVDWEELQREHKHIDVQMWLR